MSKDTPIFNTDCYTYTRCKYTSAMYSISRNQIVTYVPSTSLKSYLFRMSPSFSSFFPPQNGILETENIPRTADKFPVTEPATVQRCHPQPYAGQNVTSGWSARGRTSLICIGNWLSINGDWRLSWQSCHGSQQACSDLIPWSLIHVCLPDRPTSLYQYTGIQQELVERVVNSASRNKTTPK